MKINEVAKLTGVTVRTLHYYDKIGLLKPSEITAAGYRIYDNEALGRLQQILFFRELDFPLEEIKDIMENPVFNKTEALENQKVLLMKKRNRIDKLISLVEHTIKGEKQMSFEEFDMEEIETAKKKYAKEAKERWGNMDAYAESEKKSNHYSKEQWQEINAESGKIMKAFAENRNKAPESKEVQELVKKWQEHITARFYHCTNEILQGLGVMYTEDERFKENMDRYGAGTTELMSKAIEIYCL